jgi:hypothetical protein
MKKLFLFAIVVLGFAAVSFGQSTISASTTATLVTPIAISKTVDMNFGTIGASGTAGTVALDFSDGRVATGGVKLISGGAEKTAVFHVTGEGSNSITVSVTPGSINLTGAVTSDVITADNFVSNVLTGATLTSGSLDIKVKGILNVPANAKADIYKNNSELVVTVNYQ